MNDAGLANHQGHCGIPEIKKLQNVLPNYQIKIWSKDKYYAIWYEGPMKPLVLHLFHYDNHFIVISSVTGFLEVSYWCEYCSKGYTNRENHRCENKCKGCLKITPCQLDTWITCPDCNRFFLNQQCFDNHKSNRAIEEAQKGEKFRKVQSLCDILK